MKIGYQLIRPEKMSVGAWYSGACCPYCLRPDRWSKRGGQNKNHKSKTLRSHRDGSVGTNYRRVG